MTAKNWFYVFRMCCYRMLNSRAYYVAGVQSDLALHPFDTV